MDIPKSGQEIGTSLDIELRELLTALIRKSTKKRPQIAEEMGMLAGFPISEHMLNDWTAKRRESRRRSRFPAFLIPIFCKVTGTDELQRWASGRRLRRLLEFGESTLEMLEKKRQTSRKLF